MNLSFNKYINKLIKMNAFVGPILLTNYYANIIQLHHINKNHQKSFYNSFFYFDLIIL